MLEKSKTWGECFSFQHPNSTYTTFIQIEGRWVLNWELPSKESVGCLHVGMQWIERIHLHCKLWMSTTFENLWICELSWRDPKNATIMWKKFLYDNNESSCWNCIIWLVSWVWRLKGENSNNWWLGETNALTFRNNKCHVKKNWEILHCSIKKLKLEDK
jgi:hypothetical protein